jgi:hypothetical protein
MKTMLFLLLAVLLAAAAWAQKPTDEKSNTQIDQGAETPAGARYCGHLVDAATLVGARAKNASGEEAVVIRWLDSTGLVVHSALSGSRCIAKDGETIDGKVIVQVLPGSLAVSNRHGLTAWEAEYWNNSGEQTGGGKPHRGVFNQNRFEAELDASKASEPGNTDAEPDFRWNEEQEKLTLKPGILRGQYNSGATPGTQPCVTAPAKQEGPFGKFKKHIEGTIEGQVGRVDDIIKKRTGPTVDSGLQDSATQAINQANQQSPCTPAQGQGAKR